MTELSKIVSLKAMSDVFKGNRVAIHTNKNIIIGILDTLDYKKYPELKTLKESIDDGDSKITKPKAQSIVVQDVTLIENGTQISLPFMIVFTESILGISPLSPDWNLSDY